MDQNQNKIFISHSSQDDEIVERLYYTLRRHKQDGWIDSRELRVGDSLESEIFKAIDTAAGYMVLVSPHAHQSSWVGKELKRALRVREDRGEDYRVVVLLLDDTKIGTFEVLFDESPITVSMSSKAGGDEQAMPAILAALGLRLPNEPLAPPPEPPPPLEELLLTLERPHIFEEAGTRRAQAEATLTYVPADKDKRPVEAKTPFLFTAPLGPIETEELRWYLEKYALWPLGVFRERARKVEKNLIEWGQQLYQQALPSDLCSEVLNAWNSIDSNARRRFSVEVDERIIASDDEAITAAREAATLLLGLPWELLHNNNAYLFQGAKPVRVRRRLPNTRNLDAAAVDLPIRILLISPRPEDDSASYIDHRVSALPLVEAMETLGGQVELTSLRPPTYPTLRKELDRARDAGQPYHVVHFDGHGIYSKQVGLGGLCFEDPRDEQKLSERRSQIIYTDQLSEIFQHHRIPMFFLEACQSAQSEDDPTASVAASLLTQGVTSVVAMSHSVLVETAKRFVEAFYRSLADGQRVGDAMLAGQKALKDDDFRGEVVGQYELRMHDWFVPVLFQEQHDPQLFHRIPGKLEQSTTATANQTRFGALPEPPDHGFIGRSRDLLKLERLLAEQRYAVIRGEGGEGKTTLAVEAARWLLRSQQIGQVAFVPVEHEVSASAVLDALGRQLVLNYSVSEYSDWDKALQPIQRALQEQRTLIVLDNLESLLRPSWLAAQDSELNALADADTLSEVLALCQTLNSIGDTRIIFTSREALPEPFAGEYQRIELQRLAQDDAIELVNSVLTRSGHSPDSEAEHDTVKQLVEAVNCHARSLTLLAPQISRLDIERITESLQQLMRELEQRHPGRREQSLYASVELSLRRLSEENRERVKVLAVFHGEVDLDVLRIMMEWDEASVGALATELIGSGLAEIAPYNHLRLHPALAPYLREQWEDDDYQTLEARWVAEMRQFVGFLVQQQIKDTQLAATLTRLELPNLFVLLDRVQTAGDSAATIELANQLFLLLQYAGRPRMLARVGEIRDAAASALGEDWSHARFEAERTRIEQQFAAGQLQAAFEGAQALQAGESAYTNADYDCAMACILLGRVLSTGGAAAEAVPLLIEAQQRFEVVSQSREEPVAERMASTALIEQGDCLMNLGQLDQAAAAYEEAIERLEKQQGARSVAVAQGQLGDVRRRQKRYSEALTAFHAARQTFNAMNEPGTVAITWHQIGMTQQDQGDYDAAEQAYRQSLAIDVQQGDVAGQASTLGQLGNLYNEMGRLEEAAAFYQQAVDACVEIKNQADEGLWRNNLANTLHQLQRYDEAREEILRAIECKKPYGHAATPWTAWAILHQIETADGQPQAAAEARQRAMQAFVEYRRDGGENHSPSGRLCYHFAEALRTGQTDEIEQEMQKLIKDPNYGEAWKPLVNALQAILQGSRDPALADDPDLHYQYAAEIIVLLEQLATSS